MPASTRRGRGARACYLPFVHWPFPRSTAPKTRFVILFPGRTGSSFLVSCLSSHPEVIAEGERLVRQSASWQRDWIDGLFGAPRKAPVRAVGFKTKLKDVADRDGFARELARHEVRLVTMARRNLVKLAVSTLNARRIHAATGRWNNAADAPPLGPLEAGVEEIAAMVDRCEREQREVLAFAESLARPTLHLDYEDLLVDRDAWLRRATDFLEVSPLPLASTVGKATDDDLRAALARYDEVRDHFAATERAVDFSDPVG
jgi:LPS sulfotransferase NodH